MMQIRLMRPEDYRQVYALWISCPGMGLNNRDDSYEGILRYLKRNPETCFAAEENGEIQGVILAGHDGRRGYIYHTAVHPDHQKQGIGRQLVEAALAALRNEGIGKVVLVAFSRNEEGNAFWEKMGFFVRDDLTYRNRALVEMKRIDT